MNTLLTIIDNTLIASSYRRAPRPPPPWGAPPGPYPGPRPAPRIYIYIYIYILTIYHIIICPPFRALPYYTICILIMAIVKYLFARARAQSFGCRGGSLRGPVCRKPGFLREDQESISTSSVRHVVPPDDASTVADRTPAENPACWGGGEAAGGGGLSDLSYSVLHAPCSAPDTLDSTLCTLHSGLQTLGLYTPYPIPHTLYPIP